MPWNLFLPRRGTKGHEALRRMRFCPRRAAKEREALRRRFYHEEARRSTKPCGGGFYHEEARRDTKPCGEGLTTKGHEGTRSLAAKCVCRMASRPFAALRGQKLCRMASCFFVLFVVKAGGSRAYARIYVYSAIAFFAVTLSFLRWMVGGDGGSAAKHRGEKVWDFFKFYRGGVKILPRCRNYTTTVP